MRVSLIHCILSAFWSSPNGVIPPKSAGKSNGWKFWHRAILSVVRLSSHLSFYLVLSGQPEHLQMDFNYGLRSKLDLVTKEKRSTYADIEPHTTFTTKHKQTECVLWFNFILGLNCIFLCFDIIIHYATRDCKGSRSIAQWTLSVAAKDAGKGRRVP